MIAWLVQDTAVPAGEVDWRVLGWGLSGGLVAGMLVTALAAWVTAPNRDPVPKAQSLPGGAQWKIQDSWASNLTALTTAFGAVVLAFSDKLDGAVQPGASAAFAIATALFLGIAALSPTIYTTLQHYRPTGRSRAKETPGGARSAIIGLLERGTDPKAPGGPDQPLTGTWSGLLSAALATLVSVYSSLFALGALVVYGVDPLRGWVKWCGFLALVAVGVLVAAYAVRTIMWLVWDGRHPAGSGESLAGATSTACCEPTPMRRASLL